MALPRDGWLDLLEDRDPERGEQEIEQSPDLLDDVAPVKDARNPLPPLPQQADDFDSQLTEDEDGWWDNQARKMARWMPDRWWDNQDFADAEEQCLFSRLDEPRSDFIDLSCYTSQDYEKGVLHMTNVAYQKIVDVVRDREFKVGCTADIMTRWHEKAIGGYKHEGYEKMYILFLTDRGRCRSDQDLEREIKNPVERQRFKDKDRAAGRMEIRLFDLLRENGYGQRGFLNKGKGGEGLREVGTMLDSFVY